MKKTFKPYPVYIILLLFLMSLSCEDGENGLNSIISTEVEFNGVNCAAGGIKINYGLDANGNNILEETEIENSEYICNGDGGTLELDNLTRLELGSPNVATCGSEWFISEHDTFHYPDFNKLDYSNVSTILFVPSMVSHDNNNTVTVELFNITDNISISNTQIEHSTTEYVFKYSDDIYNSLPNNTITLGIKMKNSNPNACGGLGFRSYLYIMRE